MPEINSTTGSASANSYVSLVEFDSFIDERTDADEFADFSADEKARALIEATRRLDQESFCGAKTTETQALEFPRYDTYDQNGYYYNSDAIPRPVKNAQMELAAAFLNGTFSTQDTGLENFASFSKSDLSLTPRGLPAGRLPAQVTRYLRDFLLAGGGEIQLVRG